MYDTLRYVFIGHNATGAFVSWAFAIGVVVLIVLLLATWPECDER